MDKGSKEAEEYIREQARFYGRDPTKVLTPYQKINLAAEEMAVGTPSLLHTQQKHLELARTKVDDDGYLHRKVISRSKRLHNSDGDTSECPKRVKMTESVRLERIACIEEAIKDTDKQINYKNLQREQAGNSHQYQLCENITEEIGVLKHKRYELNTELKPLKRKQQQAAWYKTSKRKQQSDSETNNMSPSTSEQESSTSTMYPSSSSRSRSSTPGSDFPGTEHTPCRLASGPISPKPLFSPPPFPV